MDEKTEFSRPCILGFLSLLAGVSLKIVIAGELPLVEEIAALNVQVGHEVSVYLVETLRDAQTAQKLVAEMRDAEVAIECHNETRKAKRRLLEMMAGPQESGDSRRRAKPALSEVEGSETSDSGSPLLLVCALACSTTEAASWLPGPHTVSGWSAIPPLESGGAVEIARGLRTSDETAGRAAEFWRGLGLEVEEVADGPGLVRARVLCCLINEAASALMEGMASAEDIDTAMQLGTNYPHGPLAWGDLMGLDVVLGVMRGLYEEYREDRYRPSPLLVRYVQAGWLGKKAGRGFFPT